MSDDNLIITHVAAPSFMRAIGLDDPALEAAMDNCTWDRPEDLHALVNALMGVRHDSDEQRRKQLFFLSGVAAAVLSTIAHRMEK